ncbi:ferredoxin family protein [uncultured Veillonella sp.]|uniref:4Fe-4S dicluster domain-containing protein n=1 Tax=uncultured Veillonella sp. TaxID=159268 RepID=UPI0025DB288B|nr:ferredoxin family protein [uncultured Veillonella sp.]MDY3973714.1 ferredoxin family protein [Veillonella caviae]
MSIRIDQKACVGCERCLNICPGSLPQMNEQHKAYMAYPKDCWGCMACIKECPVGAIAYFLGPDMGGLAGTMKARREGTIWHWQYEGADGKVKTIDVNAQESNKY